MITASAPVVIVSVHDVAPVTRQETEVWLAELETRGLRASLLVVPGPWGSPGLGCDSGLVDRLHAGAAHGHEIVLHGWEHRAIPGAPRHRVGDLLARGCQEFHGLGPAEAVDRLGRGLGVMRSCGFEPVGFVPPGWLSSPGTRIAVRLQGLHHMSDHLGVVDVRSGERHRIPAISHRPASRARRLGGATFAAFVRHRLDRRRPVRIALHPRDLDHLDLRDTTRRALDHVASMAASGEMRAITYADLVGGVRADLVRP